MLYVGEGGFTRRYRRQEGGEGEMRGGGGEGGGRGQAKGEGGDKCRIIQSSKAPCMET